MKCPHCQKNIPTQRTQDQNSALHVDLKLIADKLNDAGYSVQKTVRFDLEWNVYSVKEYLWKSVQKSVTGKDSTTELDKLGEIELIHDTLMRELGLRCGIEWHDFPADKDKTQELIDLLGRPKL
jgi:hypothetical protein